MTSKIALLPAILLLAGCATAWAPSSQPVASANLVNANGVSLGVATLEAAGSSLNLNVSVAGLTPGERGFHLHTTGSCVAPDFKSAGGHLNPANVQHGPFNADGGHLGDLLNLVIEEDGKGVADYPLIGERDDLLAHLFDDDGTAIVIHAGPDDYQTDPAGDAGPRVACGVLTRTD